MRKSTARLSTISLFHYVKLLYRSALFVGALLSYIAFRRENGADFLQNMDEKPWILGVVFTVFAVEMILRFFPSGLESMGCQKQFRKNFRPTAHTKPQMQSWRVTLAVASAWIALNAAIGALYYTGIVDAGILLLISLAFSVCDMICILFFCPFQTWFMKNKCCGSCRIYNWDYAMMFTPLLFVRSYYTWGLLGLALLLLLAWEIAVHRHPECFSETTNACLSCANCKEKLCHHKVQLRHFLQKHRGQLNLKGYTLSKRSPDKPDRQA